MVTLKLKELSKQKERFTNGHKLCPGCGEAMTIRQFMLAFDDPVVVANATGCIEICSGTFPYTSWLTPWIHNCFPNAASTAAGVEAMYRAKVKNGQINPDKKIKVLAIAGDGGTYDIGFQALSGAMERYHNMTYICLDNQGYMNTGGQRSSATPFAAGTTTSPVGEVLLGKQQFRKDLTKIMAAHDIPYAAQVCCCNWLDLMRKAQKSMSIEGPAFINALIPCPTGWHSDPAQGLRICQKAIDSCVWPLYEVENGETKITYFPKKKIPVIEWVKGQGRFKHLLEPQNKKLVQKIQQEVDRRWEKLLKDAGRTT
jgi:pyruvate ferredoxin oxidoreductase beta subunit